MGAYFCIKWCVLLAVIGTVVCGFYLLTAQNTRVEEEFDKRYAQINPKFAAAVDIKPVPIPVPTTPVELKEIEQKISTGRAKTSMNENVKAPSIHIFYYPWYGNPKHDSGKYFHWNHNYLRHWDSETARRYPTGVHSPPDDIGSTFYPSLGSYSSRDPEVIDQHMKWMSSSGIDVVVVSWFPPGIADTQGQSWDDLMPTLLDAALKHRMKMAFHMEPYSARDIKAVRNDIEYVTRTYGNHSAIFRSVSKRTDASSTKRELPVLYFYDSYLIPESDWKRLALPKGDLSVRGTEFDVLFIGLLVKSQDRYSLLQSGFDGLYTYFASEGFSFGSTVSNWPSLAKFCRKNGLLFVPSVGPGYDDTRVRPWNAVSRRVRKDGQYYTEMFEVAHAARPDVLSITSFNEWHEGTQIEPAMPFIDNATGFVYEKYEKGPEQYLHLTLDLIKKYFTPLHDIAPGKIVSIV